MPLKHHTETAYLIVLGLVICLAGFILSLLPPLPVGLKYWGAGLVVSMLYPLVLRHTFRANRADYEFRLLHWFPFGMFVLWMIMQLTDPYLTFLHILNLGFFYLWSLPLVGLGLFFIGIFAAHVLRRRVPRIAAMVIIAVLFVGSSIFAETININPEISRALFPREDGRSTPTVADLYATTKERIGFLWQRHRRRIIEESGIGLRPVASITTAPVPRTSSSSRSIAVNPATISSSASKPPVVTKPDALTNSGPEGVALLALTLFALYVGTLHKRAALRV